jgi:ribosome biogenesis protein Nip4
MGEMRKSYKILFGKAEEKRPFRRPRRRWEDNIRMYLREEGWEDVHWIHLAQYRDWWCALVNTVTNFWVPQKPGMS